jgi:hypothetical protein
MPSLSFTNLGKLGEYVILLPNVALILKLSRISDGVAMLLSTKLHLNMIALTAVAFGVILLNELAFTVYGPADG